MDERLTVDRVFVPIDGTENSLAAADYAIEIADRYDAALLVTHVLGPETRQAITDGTTTPETVATETNTRTDRIRERATDRGVPMRTLQAYGFSTTRKIHHPGNVILATVEQTASDFIVLPREAGGDLLGKAAGHVLAYADQPVLSV